jgi:outer membrane protein assembly factor BamE (lipoprotein component of BamABCDE complex)
VHAIQKSLAFAFFPLILLLSGCISYSANQLAPEGSFPSTTALSLVKPGVTDSSWLIQQFGYPANITAIEAGTEQWQYQSTFNHSTHVRVFPLLAVNLAKSEVKVYHFELVDDRVIRHWQDETQ